MAAIWAVVDGVGDAVKAAATAIHVSNAAGRAGGARGREGFPSSIDGGKLTMSVNSGVTVSLCLTPRALAGAGLIAATYMGLRYLWRRAHAVRIDAPPDALPGQGGEAAADGERRPVVVVTGASKGIGAQVARQAARRGAVVVLVARSEEALRAVADRINAEGVGGAAVVAAADCSDGAAVAALAEKIIDSVGAPDVVINCAGAGRWRYLHEMPSDEIAQCMKAPYLAAAHTSREFLPAMVARGTGSVVMVQSPAAYTAFGGATAYIATRWALRGLSAALQADASGSGVMIQEVVLGETDSEYFDANPGSRERIPALTRWIRPLSTADAGSAVLAAVDSGRPLTVYPFTLWVLLKLNTFFPGTTATLATWTGWRNFGAATIDGAAGARK